MYPIQKNYRDSMVGKKEYGNRTGEQNQNLKLDFRGFAPLFLYSILHKILVRSRINYTNKHKERSIMQNKTTSREDVNKILVSDLFFNKNNLSLKLRQSVLTLLGWIGVLFPFIWVLAPYFFDKEADRIHFFPYVEIGETVTFLLIFFSIIFPLIIVSSITLTIWNNKRYKRLLTKKTVVNEDTLEKSKASLESFYDARFGSKEFRENIRFYTVSAEKNIEIEDIKILYSKGKE